MEMICFLSRLGRYVPLTSYVETYIMHLMMMILRYKDPNK